MPYCKKMGRFWAVDVSVLSEATRSLMMGAKVSDEGVAFDKTVRRKPLVGAADAVYGNSIDFCLESIARSGIQQKRCY
jgi:hypothetical protein